MSDDVPSQLPRNGTMGETKRAFSPGKYNIRKEKDNYGYFSDSIVVARIKPAARAMNRTVPASQLSDTKDSKLQILLIICSSGKCRKRA